MLASHVISTTEDVIEDFVNLMSSSEKPVSLAAMEALLLEHAARKQEQNSSALVYGDLLNVPSIEISDVPLKLPTSSLVSDPATFPIVIFCDGTGHAYDNPYPTNIKIMYDLVCNHYFAGCDRHAPSFPIRYVNGIGTSSSSDLVDALDQMVAFTFFETLRTIFRMLRSIDVNDRDIIIFGFSRGSFMSRALTGLLRWTGVPTPKLSDEDCNDCVNKYMIACLKRKSVDNLTPRWTSASPPPSDSGFKLAKLRFLGLFDTVPGVEDMVLSAFDLYCVPDDSFVQSSCHILANDITNLYQNVSFDCHETKTHGFDHSLECVPANWSAVAAGSAPNATNHHHHYEFRVMGDHSNIGGGWFTNPDTIACISNATLRMMLLCSPFADIARTLPPSGNLYRMCEDPKTGIKSILNREDMKEYPYRYALYSLIELLKGDTMKKLTVCHHPAADKVKHSNTCDAPAPPSTDIDWSVLNKFVVSSQGNDATSILSEARGRRESLVRAFLKDDLRAQQLVANKALFVTLEVDGDGTGDKEDEEADGAAATDDDTLDIDVEDKKRLFSAVMDVNGDNDDAARAKRNKSDQ